MYLGCVIVKMPRRKWVIQMKRIFAIVLCSAVMICTAFAASVPANPTREIGQEVYVNDTRVYPTAYNISGNNYFKLRDIGKLAGFGVDWDGETQTVKLSSQRIPVDLAGISDTSVSGAVAKRSTQRFALDGYYINVTAYLIGGNNYGTTHGCSIRYVYPWQSDICPCGRYAVRRVPHGQ